jgi:hypothetical protein
MVEFMVEPVVVFLRCIARFAGCAYKIIFFNDLDDFPKGYQQAYQQKTGITLHVSGAMRHERSGRHLRHLRPARWRA